VRAQRDPQSPIGWPTRTMAWLVLALALALPGFLTAAQSQESQPGPVVLLDVKGAIGPATTEYLLEGLETARERGAPLVVLRMDTPGGLDSATRDIIAAVLASDVPVATYVAPAGARAASAGTYILFASHLAAMAPGTHLGAATPVQLGGPGSPLPGPAPKEGEEKGSDTPPADAMSAKVVNDAAAYMASLAALHGRNAEWAERAVREAATLTSEGALRERVVEIVAGDLEQLLAQADGRTVQVAGRPQVLSLAGRSVVEITPNWRTQALGVLTNPNVAYLLLLVGVYGLIFEFLSPGGVGPGVVGAIALVMALFALNLLPVHYAGLGLLVLGIALMTVEAFTPSLGIIGVGGAIAFALGSLLLFKGPVPEMRVAPGVVIAVTLASLGYFVLALGAAMRSRRAAVVSGADTLLGAVAEVVSWSGGQGLVALHGETWQARSPTPLEAGGRARVTGRSGLILTVEPHDKSAV
jgi:membrane-bound serine protease (ClpP class)